MLATPLLHPLCQLFHFFLEEERLKQERKKKIDTRVTWEKKNLLSDLFHQHLGI